MSLQFPAFPTRILGATTLNSGGTATVTSSAFDAKNLNDCRGVIATVTFGAIAATGNLSFLKLQGSQDNSTYVDVLTFTTLPSATSDNLIWEFQFTNVQTAYRYFKVVATTATAADVVIENIVARGIGNVEYNAPVLASAGAVLRN